MESAKLSTWEVLHFRLTERYRMPSATSESEWLTSMTCARASLGISSRILIRSSIGSVQIEFDARGAGISATDLVPDWETVAEVYISRDDRKVAEPRMHLPGFPWPFDSPFGVPQRYASRLDAMTV